MYGLMKKKIDFFENSRPTKAFKPIRKLCSNFTHIFDVIIV